MMKVMRMMQSGLSRNENTEVDVSVNALKSCSGEEVTCQIYENCLIQFGRS